MTRWMHPPEIEREREQARFDPIVEGARHRLSRELSLAIWDQVRADATDGAGRCDTEQARRRFHDLAARIAARGGRLRPDIGRATRVAAEAGDDSLASWTTELRIHTPGRETLVASELRRWTRTGHAPRTAPEDRPDRIDRSDGIDRSDRIDRTPRRELPGAGEVARAMAALAGTERSRSVGLLPEGPDQRSEGPAGYDVLGDRRKYGVPARPAQDQVRPLRAPMNAVMHAAQRRPREIDLRAWAPPGRAANDAVRAPDWLARADRAAQVGEAVRLHRAGALAEALGRGQPGLADAVAAALHDGAILAPHPVDALRDSVRGLGADLAVVGHGVGRAAARFLGTTSLAPVGRRAFAAADAWTGGAARAWSDRARGWADGVARRAMAYRDAAAAHGAEDELARLSSSGGAPLPAALRARMEALFGHGFAHVRVHTDGAAAQAAEVAGARAVAIGSNIYFNRGQFAPGTEAGDRLLLHELTHVVQHDQGRLPEPAGGRVELSSPSDPAEREARAMEARAGELRAVEVRTGEARDRAPGGAAHVRASDGEARDRAPGGETRDRAPGGAVHVRTSDGGAGDRAPGGETRDRAPGGAVHVRTSDGGAGDRTPGGAVHVRTSDGGAGDRAPGGEARVGAAEPVLEGAAAARTMRPDQAPPRPAPAGDTPRTGRRASPNIFGDAVDWVGDRVDDIENWAEDKIEGLVAKVAPGLVTLIHEGPGGLIKDAIQPAVSSWVGTVTGGVNIGQVAGQLKSSFSAAFEVLQGAKAGDAKCCETLVNGINAIRQVAHAFMNNPVMDAIKGILTKVSDIIGTVTKLVIGPAFDVLKTIVGGAWDAIKSVASTIQGWFNAVKNVAGKAFDWVAKKLGFSSGTGEGGLLDWLKQKASEIWDKIKQTLQPVIGPLKVVAGVLLMFTGLPQIYAIIKYGPQIVEAIQWLWANRNNPEAVKKNPGLIGGSILPKILGVGQSFVGMVKSGVSWLVDKTTAFVTGALQLAGAITGIPLLGMAKSFVQTLVDGIKSVQQWAAGAFTSAETWLEGTFHKIADFIKPYAEVLCSVGMAIVNPGMIPVILAGWAWRWLPDCIKPPLIDLLLDAVIAVLEGMPSLPMLGPLWPLLKSGVLGFLHALRAKDPATKIKVSNKLAKIISGASPMFLLGFVKGFLRGVWDGIKMPFEAIYLVIKGLGKAVEFFDALGNEADTKAEKPATPNQTPQAAQTPQAPHPKPASNGAPPVSAPSVIHPDQIQGVVSGMATQLNEHKPPRPAAPASAAAAAPAAPANHAGGANANQYKQLGQEAHRMGGELAGPAATVESNFWPAVQELFSSKGGGSIDDLIGKLGKVWEAAKAAIASLGGKIANMICDFFVKDSAEEELGDTVGYMVGMIAFQALLEYLSAGTWDGVMAVLQAVAKFLNWPMEFLGEAMGLLKELGGFLLDGIKELGQMAVEGASSALGEVMGALGDIGTKLEEFAEEILGKFGKEAEAEAGAVESQAAHAAEGDAAKAAESDVAKTAETDAADAAKAEEEGELSAAEKEAQKAEEMVEAEAVIQGIKRGAAAGHVPGPALVMALDGLKSRYSWIEGFGPVGQPAPFELMMFASEHDEGRYDPGPIPGELPGGEPKPEGPKPEGEGPKPEGEGPKPEPTAADVENWKKDLPTKPTPTSSPQDLYEIKHTGPTNYHVSGNGEEIWADGIRSEDQHLLDAKLVDNPERSPFIADSKCPDFIRDKILPKVEDEFRRYAAVIADSNTPVKALEVITNDARAVPYFEGLLEKYGIPGSVVVKP